MYMKENRSRHNKLEIAFRDSSVLKTVQSMKILEDKILKVVFQDFASLFSELLSSMLMQKWF